MCKVQLTITCQVRCTVKCSRNRTYKTVAFAQTVADDRLRGLRKCQKTAEANARAMAWVSYPKCKVTRCDLVTGIAKPKIARGVYFALPGERRLAAV